MAEPAKTSPASPSLSPPAAEPANPPPRDPVEIGEGFIARFPKIMAKLAE